MGPLQSAEKEQADLYGWRSLTVSLNQSVCEKGSGVLDCWSIISLVDVLRSNKSSKNSWFGKMHDRFVCPHFPSCISHFHSLLSVPAPNEGAAVNIEFLQPIFTLELRSNFDVLWRTDDSNAGMGCLIIKWNAGFYCCFKRSELRWTKKNR